METAFPSDWHSLESLCASSGGHLVSLNHYELEESLASRANLTDYWCGGNMCPDSPAPANSMWSDGSPQELTNFAYDSGLDGAHCCVKVEVVDAAENISEWRGEGCESILKGICEFEVEGESTATSFNRKLLLKGIFYRISRQACQPRGFCHDSHHRVRHLVRRDALLAAVRVHRPLLSPGEPQPGRASLRRGPVQTRGHVNDLHDRGQ